jgi:DNA ligase D-like protein (predicted 3'-phosphoesterase)
MDGVLKSWAIPKDPPTKPNIKRLAIPVEDHPLDYINFEGVIPEGGYGAGTVKIWDSGTYELESRTPSKIVFRLLGKKMRGRYVLIQTKWGKGINWLLFQAKE